MSAQKSFRMPVPHRLDGRSAGLFQGRDQDTLANLERLYADLAGLEARCGIMAVIADPMEAYSKFKSLPSLFGDVLSFIAVIGARTAKLEEAKRSDVEAQLVLLRRRLVQLHLRTAAPLLRRIEDSGEPLSLGIHHVLDQWLNFLDQMEGYPGVAETLPDSNKAGLKALRELAHSLMERAVSLPDFSDQAASHPERFNRSPAPLRRLQGMSRESRGKPAGPVRLVMQQRQGLFFVNTRASSPVLLEIRRLGLIEGLAAAMGISRSHVVMVLNGRDPLTQERVNMAVDFLKRSLGEERFDYLAA